MCADSGAGVSGWHCGCCRVDMGDAFMAKITSREALWLMATILSADGNDVLYDYPQFLVALHDFTEEDKKNLMQKLHAIYEGKGGRG